MQNIEIPAVLSTSLLSCKGVPNYLGLLLVRFNPSFIHELHELFQGKILSLI